MKVHHLDQPIDANNDMRDLTLCHVISGDVWGGAESQALALLQGLSKHARVRAVVFNQGELSARLEKTQIPVNVVEESRLGFPSLVRSVHSILKETDAALVHVHGFKEHLVGGLAGRWLRIPVIRTYHGRGLIGVRRRYDLIERFNSAFLSDRSIAVSEDLSRFLALAGMRRNKINVIRNGIQYYREPTEQFPPRPDPALDGRTCHIGTVGRLVPVKNHRCLLDAFKLVCDEISLATLTIVGDGPLASELQAYAESLDISNRVQFAGFQKHVGEYLRSFSVFVLSSLHEGIPMALLEAMRMNIPVVCARVGGIPEVVVDQYNGLLVQSDDARSLSQAILKLARDRSLAGKLSANAQQTLSKELSFDRCLANTMSLYCVVLP